MKLARAAGQKNVGTPIQESTGRRILRMVPQDVHELIARFGGWLEDRGSVEERADSLEAGTMELVQGASVDEAVRAAIRAFVAATGDILRVPETD